MKILRLDIDKEIYDKVKSGERSILFYPVTEEWRKLLIGIHYDEIHLICEDQETLKRKWRLVAKENLVTEDGEERESFVVDVGKGITGVCLKMKFSEKEIEYILHMVRSAYSHHDYPEIDIEGFLTIVKSYLKSSGMMYGVCHNCLGSGYENASNKL